MTIKNKISLSLIIFIILSIILIYFVVYPILREIKNDSQNLIFKKQSLLSLEGKIEDLKQFQKLCLEIRPNLEKLDKLFVDPEVPVEFIRFLEKTAEDCGLAVEISPAPVFKKTEGPWPYLFFRISSTASFSKFLKFLEKLESNVYLMEIQSLNVARLTETELKSKGFEKFSLGDVRTTLSIKVYTQ